MSESRVDDPTPDAETSADERPVETAEEPPEATHQAEDETWDPGPGDLPDLKERLEAAEARITELEETLAVKEGEVEAAKERALRARADYDNLQRRTGAERAEMERVAAARIIERLLDTVEVLEKAATEAEGADDPRAKGLRMAHDGMQRVLADEGLEPVPGAGEAFDHHVHQAIAREPADEPEGTVVEVVRPGYTLHGKLLRAALVKVSAGPE